VLLHLTKGKYLPIVKQRNLALKKITLFERTLFTFAGVVLEVPNLIYQSENLTSTHEHSQAHPTL